MEFSLGAWDFSNWMLRLQALYCVFILDRVACTEIGNAQKDSQAIKDPFVLSQSWKMMQQTPITTFCPSFTFHSCQEELYM